MKYRLNGEEFDNQRDYRKALKESEEEKNAYDLWSEEEDSELEELSEEDNTSINELADNFKRTELAIILTLFLMKGSFVILTNGIEIMLLKSFLKKAGGLSGILMVLRKLKDVIPLITIILWVIHIRAVTKKVNGLNGMRMET